MPEDKKWEIADAADMIVSGFAFKRCGETIQIVNLNKNEPHVMIISRIKDGQKIARMDFMNAENYRQDCANSLAVFS